MRQTISLYRGACVIETPSQSVTSWLTSRAVRDYAAPHGGMCESSRKAQYRLFSGKHRQRRERWGHPPQQPTAADLEPGTLGWRAWVAVCAHSFFKTPQDPGVAAAIGKTVHPTNIEPWSIADYSKYLSTRGLRDAGKIVALTQITDALERAGFLLPSGMAPNLPQFTAQRYMTQGGASPGQVGGNLWLSEIFGAELIIPSYNAVTVQISGTDSSGNQHWGSGLVLDHTHIVTNKHVVAELAPGSPLTVTPSTGEDVGQQVTCETVAHPHPELDIALLEARLPEGVGIPRLAGMAFRDPAWADDVYLFGYPHVPMITAMAITVQRGEVVNPASETPAGGGLPRQKTFLHSAIARPGNSGGPIVAHDGRVIGLVAEDSSPTTHAGAAGYDPLPPATPGEWIDRIHADVEELKAKVRAPSFYRGIPSSEVIRALEELGFGGLATIDEPPPNGPSMRFQRG